MAVGIRRTPGVTVTPQTASGGGRRQSALEGIASLASALGGLGTAMQRFSTLRNDRKFAQETAKANAYWLSTNDQFESIAAQVSATDLEGLNAALNEPTKAAVDWADENLTTDRAKSAFYSKLEALKNRLQDGRMAAQGEAIATKQVDDAYRVAAQHVQPIHEVAEQLNSQDPGVRHTARVSLKNAEDQFLGPESVLAARFGLPAAQKAYAKYMTEVGRATGISWLLSMDGKNVVEAERRFLAQGAPDADHKTRFYGSEDTWEERLKTVQVARRLRSLADEERDKQTKALDKALEAKNEAYVTEQLIRIGEGAVLDPREIALNAPDPTAKGTQSLIKEVWNGPRESNAQRIAGEDRATRADRRPRSHFIGTSTPGALGELSMELRARVMARNRPDPPQAARGTLVAESDGRRWAEARNFHGLNPEQKGKVQILDQINKYRYDPTAALTYTPEQLASLDFLSGKARGWVTDPTFDDQAAYDIFVAARDLPGDVARGLVSAFDTEEALAELREDPKRVLGMFPTIRQDLIVPAEAGGIDAKRTMMQMHAKGLSETHRDYKDTMLALIFLEETARIRVFVDPTLTPKLQSARANAASAMARARATHGGAAQGQGSAILPAQPPRRGR